MVKKSQLDSILSYGQKKVRKGVIPFLVGAMALSSCSKGDSPIDPVIVNNAPVWNYPVAEMQKSDFNLGEIKGQCSDEDGDNFTVDTLNVGGVNYKLILDDSKDNGKREYSLKLNPDEVVNVSPSLTLNKTNYILPVSGLVASDLDYDAVDSDGSIAKTNLYKDGTLVDKITSVGNYELSVVDNEGLETEKKTFNVDNLELKYDPLKVMQDTVTVDGVTCRGIESFEKVPVESNLEGATYSLVDKDGVKTTLAENEIYNAGFNTGEYNIVAEKDGKTYKSENGGLVNLIEQYALKLNESNDGFKRWTTDGSGASSSMRADANRKDVYNPDLSSINHNDKGFEYNIVKSVVNGAGEKLYEEQINNVTISDIMNSKFVNNLSTACNDELVVGETYECVLEVVRSDVSDKVAKQYAFVVSQSIEYKKAYGN